MSGTIISDLVFDDIARQGNMPGSHVLIIGVGKYAYGKGANATPVGGDLRQLSSPPLSAREIANWFILSFKSAAAPLASVSLLISEPQAGVYTTPLPGGGRTFQVPPATLSEVKDATGRGAGRLVSHRDNMGVFYFCGHGASQGQQLPYCLRISVRRMLRMRERSTSIFCAER
jgi:hypothetical protein